jgi:hydroxypyruvate isomerase
LREVARVLADVNGVAMVEALSGAPAYPLTSVADAAAVVTRVTADAGPANVGILLDLYHLAANGDDLTQAIEVYGPNAAHVQLADLPGRGVPGSGTLPLAAHVARLRALGYDGWIALEYPDADGASVMHLTDDDRKALA